MAGPWEQFKSGDKKPWEKFASAQAYQGGDVQAGDYTPLSQRPQEEQKSLPRRITTALTHGIVNPPMQFIGHQAQLAQKAQERLGLSNGAPANSMYAPRQVYNLPEKLGGRVEVNAPTSGTQAARQLIGEGLQTSLLGIPGSNLAKLGFVKGGAAVGGGFGLGSAIESASSPGEAAMDVGGGLLAGAIMGKGAQLVGRGLAALPRSVPEAAARLKALPAKMSDYFLPRAKAASLSEDIHHGVADVRAQFQALKEEASGLGLQKKQLATQRAEKTALGKSDSATLETQWEKKITDAQKGLDSAIEKGIPELKQQVRQVHNNMTKTYGEILDKAVEGKTFSRQDYQKKVVDPLLDMMAEDGVPKDARIYRSIENLVKVAKQEAAPQVTGFSSEAKKAVADPMEEMLTAKEFRHLRKKVQDTVTEAVKSGQLPSKMYDHWANEFTSLQGKFVQDYAPELASANKAYRDMAFARKTLWQKTRPLTENDLDGATRLLTRIAAGDKLSATERAVIKLAEEGKGPLPGIGKGKIGANVRPASQTVADRELQFKMVSDGLQSRLATEKQSLTKQIVNIETRLKAIQGERAVTTRQTQMIDELRAKQKRLMKISRWERGLAITALGLGGASQAKKVLPAISHLASSP